MTGSGIALGLAGAFGLARFMAAMVFGVTPYDPLTFGAAPLVLALVAAFATIIPARRAARIDPMRALHEN